MIKGVNKRIIEVRETDSRVFDSALLFVSPAYCGSDESKLKKEADRVLSVFEKAMNNEACNIQAVKVKKKHKKGYPIAFLSGILVGVLFAFIIRL